MTSWQNLTIAAFLILHYVCPASGQSPTITTRMDAVRTKRRIDETTPVFDKETGQRVSYQEYLQRMKTDPYAYHLEPTYDEYGKPASYTIRPATTEEKETHRFYGRDATKQPKVGQPIAPFVMTGLDGKTYRSVDLRNNVVVLSFWVSLDKPFWGEKQAADFGDALRPYQSETSPVVLGILNSGQPRVIDHLNKQTLPFMPVPNAYGFHDKYQISRIPSFVVIDRAGQIAAFIEGPDYQALKQVLSRITR